MAVPARKPRKKKEVGEPGSTSDASLNKRGQRYLAIHESLASSFEEHSTRATLAKTFLESVLQYEEGEWLVSKVSATYHFLVPQNETYFPWALLVASDRERAEYEATKFLGSSAGRPKSQVLVLTPASIVVIEREGASSVIPALHSQFGIDVNQAWNPLLSRFSKTSNEIKTRKVSSETLAYAKRFGHLPQATP